jgi:hypothetical protein
MSVKIKKAPSIPLGRQPQSFRTADNNLGDCLRWKMALCSFTFYHGSTNVGYPDARLSRFEKRYQF